MRARTKRNVRTLRSSGLPSIYWSVSVPGILRVSQALIGRELAMRSHIKGTQAAFETLFSPGSKRIRTQIAMIVIIVARSETI
jgi:hypothetical protein